MTSFRLGARWIAEIVFVLIGLLVFFLKVLPLSPGGAQWPGPIWMLCLTLAWMVRRPDQISPIIIAGLFLILDILLIQPIGLWAFIVLLGSEFVRRRARRWRDQAFVFEWLQIAVLMGLMILGQRVIMILFLLDVPPLGQTLLQILATITAYPLVVLLAYWGIGLRRMSAIDMNKIG